MADPASVGMHLAMSALLLVPFIYFAHALDKIWRAHRGCASTDSTRTSSMNVNAAATQLIREDYQRRHGHGPS